MSDIPSERRPRQARAALGACHAPHWGRACAAALLSVVCAPGVPATPCEERIDEALKVNEQLRAAVAASAPDDVKERALELLDRAAEPLRTACKRGGPWEGEALMRAGGYHGDVRSLLGEGKRPL